jgi:hypothetical protein
MTHVPILFAPVGERGQYVSRAFHNIAPYLAA